MSQLSRLAFLFAAALIFAPACASENTSTRGQLIECAQSANGPTNCAPTDSATPSAPGMCVDVDEDGDGDDHDEMDDEDEDHEGGTSEMDDDDDDDGTADAGDADDDNDGVSDADDCDEDAGGDDHD